MAKDDLELHMLGNSWEIWQFLVKKTGLDPTGYDQLIVDDICKQLNILPPCKNLSVELKNKNISSEQFIGVFLKSLQPYAQMMSDLCVFFCLHGIKKTNKELKILFDFGQGPEDLGFDLQHFREVLWKYRRVMQPFSVIGWNHNTLWMLNGIFRDYQKDIIMDSGASKWQSLYVKGEFGFPYPSLPTTGVDEIDGRLFRVWNVWQTIVGECIKHGCTRQDLSSNAEIYQRSARNETNIEDKEESYEYIRRTQELPYFEDWDARTIYVLDRDRWPERLLIGIFRFIEYINSIAQDERLLAASDVVRELDKLFANLPHNEIEEEVLEKELLELLNLPIWSRRHELYQTWILSQIDKALKDYERVIHHVDGHLVLSFSGTHLGTIETTRGRLHLWSELRSHLAAPIGKGRKSHIQPDYSLTFEPISEPRQTVLAIECKQYKKASVKNFSEALIDYANGRINANVLLVNYGPTTQRVLDSIDNNIKPRTSLIGNLMPGSSDRIREFRDYVCSTLPTAISAKSHEGANSRIFDLIIIDVSGSMSNYFSSEPIVNIIKLYTTTNPQAQLLAVNTYVKKKWDTAGKGYSELLKMPSGGNTDLPGALSAYNIKKGVIVTDTDGWSQVLKMSYRPLLTIEISNAIELVFHYRE